MTPRELLFRAALVIAILFVVLSLAWLLLAIIGYRGDPSPLAP
jgi:hypothetical protein